MPASSINFVATGLKVDIARCSLPGCAEVVLTTIFYGPAVSILAEWTTKTSLPLRVRFHRVKSIELVLSVRALLACCCTGNRCVKVEDVTSVGDLSDARLCLVCRTSR